MTFHVYAVMPGPGQTLANTGGAFSLAGKHLLRQAWQTRNCPVNAGWNVTADEMIRLRTGGTESYKSHRLIIDYYPSNRREISLIELLEVFVFKYETWTPLMLKLRDVWCYSSDVEMTQAQRDALKAQIVPDYGAEEFIEFLYLQGNWNWGRNGSTNAAFIQGAARNYFR